MSEGQEEFPNANNGASWWGSWYSSARAKTTTVFEAVKKDLDELSTVVRTEASNVGAAIESTLKLDEENSTVGTVKKSISSFFGQVTEALVPSLEDDEAEAVLITHDGVVTLTGFQKHLADLQKNDKTYLEEPQHELVDNYKMWLEVVDQDQFTQNRLARHLTCSEILNDKYTNLVPDKLSHMEFWQRYLFKRALLEDALANAEIAERRAKTEINSTQPVSPRKNIIVQTEQPKLACSEVEKADETKTIDSPQEESKPKSPEKEMSEEDFNWETEEIPSNVELTEEEQTRLLEQYEQEIQEREKRKSIVLTDQPVIDDKKKPATKSPEKKTPQNKKSEKNVAAKQPPSDSKKKQQQHNKNTGKQPTEKAPQNAADAAATTTTTTNTKSNQKQSTKQSNQKSEAPLKLDKDHFNKDEISSSTSDESWEKDFDMNE